VRPRGVATPPTIIPISRYCPASDTDRLVADGHVSVVSADDERQHPTLSYMVVHTVMEPRKHRRRLVGNPIDVNKAISLPDDRFKLLPPLEHIAHALHLLDRRAASGEKADQDRAASVLDLSLAFWQFRLPRAARQYQRFRDASGRLLEFNKMVMGHKLAVHLAHLCTAALAGHPAVVNAQHVPRGVAHDIYVDGCLHVGPPDRVAEARKQTLARAARVGASFKIDADEPPVTRGPITWRGAEWDFRPRPIGTVRLADKTRDKLVTPITEATRMTAADAVSLVGRLVYAAGLLQYPLVRYFPAMQWFRALCRRLNKQQLSPTDIVAFPAQHAASIDLWRRDSLATKSPNIVAISASSTGNMFVDATLHSFAAILVTPENRVYIVAGCFDDADFPRDIDRSKAIAYCEALAVLKGIVLLQRHVRRLSSLVLWEDNTVVENAVRKGNTRAAHVAPVVADILRRTGDWRLAIRAERIASDQQPADAPSRGRPVDLDQLSSFMSSDECTRATGRWLDTRQGAGRIVMGRTSSPSRVATK
jgi:hypothetical protein